MLEATRSRLDAYRGKGLGWWMIDREMRVDIGSGGDRVAVRLPKQIDLVE